jgi:predicted nucleic acid-binding protein
VGLRLSVDTSFLIDLQRERSRGETAGPAHRPLASAPDAELALSVVALGEFAEGFANAEHPVVRIVREQHTLLSVDEETALIYAGLVRDLRRRGELIGTNDLWIAASSLRHGLPVLTGNVDHFGRIEGLEVVSYRS